MNKIDVYKFKSKDDFILKLMKMSHKYNLLVFWQVFKKYIWNISKADVLKNLIESSSLFHAIKGWAKKYYNKYLVRIAQVLF